MVGRDLKNIFPKLQVKPGAVVFEAKNLCSEGVFKNISFTVRRGEILGLSGLVGAGRTEIVRAIFGLDKLDSGEIYLDEKKIVISNPQKAIQHGIAMVSEDRKSVGLVLCRSVLENIALPNLDHFSRIFLLNKSRELEECNSISKKLSIKASNLNQVSEALSGGNQQKVVISKWLLSNAKVMILDEPTRGIDVGAKAEIHRLMSELAMNGMAVIMISSEMPEIVSMSDRILVIGDGKIKGEFCKNENQTNEELQEVILRCALEEK
jgi:ABC-type sugar transport system ATPase subunit